MSSMSIAGKDLRIFARERGQLVMVFLLPLVFVVGFGAMLGLQSDSSQEITLAVGGENLDEPAARDLRRGLTDAGGIVVEPMAMDQGMAALADGEIDRLLLVPEGLSLGLAQGRPVRLRLLSGPEADSDDTEAVLAIIDGVAKDMSLEHQLIAALEQMGDMMGTTPGGERIFAADRVVSQAAGQFERARTQPLVAIETALPEKILRQREEFSPVDLGVPGVAVLFVFLTATTTAMSLFSERKIGTFRRLIAAPISKTQIVLGKMLPSVLRTLVQIIVIFAVSTLVLPLLGLGSLSLGDPVALIVLSVLIAFCSSSLGLFLAAIARTENQISTLGAVLLWVMGAVSGAFVPQFFLGGFLGAIGKVVPHYWAISAYQDVLVRGEGLLGIGRELGVLLGFTAVFAAVGLWRFRFGTEG